MKTVSGELWIGSSYEGLYHYNRATDTFVHYIHGQKDANSGSGYYSYCMMTGMEIFG